MTPQQRETILHSLGLTPRGKRQRRWSFRNFYCAHQPPSAHIADLRNAGWLRPGRTINEGTARFYYVTKAAAEAAGVLDRCRREDVKR